MGGAGEAEREKVSDERCLMLDLKKIQTPTVQASRKDQAQRFKLKIG
jgi:hypothetical protein